MQVIKLIPDIGFKKNDDHFNKCCDVCQRTKQTSERFPVSDFRASNVFKLTHCDL